MGKGEKSHGLLRWLIGATEKLPFNLTFVDMVPTSKNETIELRLREVDGEEGVFLCKKNYKSLI